MDEVPVGQHQDLEMLQLVRFSNVMRPKDDAS